MLKDCHLIQCSVGFARIDQFLGPGVSLCLHTFDRKEGGREKILHREERIFFQKKFIGTEEVFEEEDASVSGPVQVHAFRAERLPSGRSGERIYYTKNGCCCVTAAAAVIVTLL